MNKVSISYGVVLIIALCVPASGDDQMNSTSISKAISSENSVVLYSEGFKELDLNKGMSKSLVESHLHAMGWRQSPEGTRVLPSNPSAMWINDPCGAAHFHDRISMVKISNDRPPKQLELTAYFFVCDSNDVKERGKLSKIELKTLRNPT